MADGVMTKSLQSWAITNARTTGFYKGKDMNEQNDNMTESSTIMHRAEVEWGKWAGENDITVLNTSPDTYQLMQEAFIDGYTNGFVKRFTEGE